MKRPVGRKKQIPRKLHGQGRCALHSTAGVDIAIGSASDSPHVDAPVTIEIFVLDRSQGVAQPLRKVVVRSDHTSLQCERTNDPALPVVKLSNGAGTIMFQLLDLRKIGG